ncbi:unnamed protein product [Cylindrotheca closterium]|uniref:Uncharacterized protein n=1 Tax=Cylindrotheca closterium TaxID=2856 RepID=A0AAD2JKR1_9STRA|nr:unnamed protein product [Cylindrotheca closterium]
MVTTSKTQAPITSSNKNSNNNDCSFIDDASPIATTQTADCQKGKNKLLAQFTTARPGSPPRIIHDLLHATFSDNASPECYIDEAVDITKAEETRRSKRQSSLRRKEGSSISERSVKELLHDNSDRLSSLLMQSRSSKVTLCDGFLSGDDDSDLEDE